jgi:hypothetical protein
MDVCVEKACDLPYCPCVQYEKKEYDISSDENKLFGSTRGMYPVMDRSCMFSWRQNAQKNTVTVFGYGWRDPQSKPWITPGQNPYMADVVPYQPYLMQLTKWDQSCNYLIWDSQMNLIANASTVHLQGGTSSGVKFLSFFGGQSPATQSIEIIFQRPSSKIGGRV